MYLNMAEGKVSTRNSSSFFNLKTAAVLIGIIELVVWSVLLTLSTLSLSAISGLQFEDGATTATPSDQPIKIPEEDDESSGMTNGFSMRTLYILLIVSVTLAVVRILNGSILLFGVHTNSTALLKLWLFIKILTFLVTMGSFLGTWLKAMTTVTTDVVYGVSLLASVFFIFIVISLHARITAENHGRSLRYKF